MPFRGCTLPSPLAQTPGSDALQRGRVAESSLEQGHTAALLAACALTLALAPACKRETPTTNPLPSTASAPTTMTAADADSSVSVPPVAAPAEPPQAPQLFLIAKSAFRLGVAKLEGATLLYDTGIPMFARVAGDDLIMDASLRSGLPIYGAEPQLIGWLMSVGGRFPESLWLTVGLSTGRGSWENHLFQWTKGTWEMYPDLHDEVHVNAYFEQVMPWAKGSMLTLHTSSMQLDDDLGPMNFVVVAGPKPPILPEDSSGPRLKDRPDWERSRITPVVGGFQALQSGEIFIIGYDKKASNAGIVERFKPGDRVGTFDRLPGGGQIRPASLFVRAANDVFVGGYVVSGKSKAPYLAHFDGAAWSIEETPGTESIVAIAGTDDGSLWIGERSIQWESDRTITSGSEIYFRPRGGAFRKISLPEGAMPRSVPMRLVADGADIYLSIWGDNTVSHGTTHAEELYRTRPAKTVLDFHPLVGKKTALQQTLRPATPACEKVFVVLYTLSLEAPVDYDFPSTRTALKGHKELAGVTFVETDDGLNRYLGAFVPSFEMGRTLASVIRQRLASARPQLLCGEPPHVRRTLRINLETGALEKNGEAAAGPPSTPSSAAAPPR